MEYQVIHYLLCHVYRDCESYALGIWNYCRIYPYHPAAQVNERTSAVARVDCGISLHKTLKVYSRRLESPVFCRDDTCSHRVFKPQRISYRHDPLSHFCRVGITQKQDRKIRGLYLYYGKIECGVLSDLFRIKRPAVKKGHLYLVCTFDNMVVCKDIAIFVNDEPRALAPLRHHPLLHSSPSKKVFSEEFFKERIPSEGIAHYPLFYHCFCVYVDDCRRTFLYDRYDRVPAVDILGISPSCC